MLHFERDESDDRNWRVMVYPIASNAKQVATIKKFHPEGSVFVTPCGDMMTLSALQHLAKGAEMIAESQPETAEGHFTLGKGVGKGYTHE